MNFNFRVYGMFHIPCSPARTRITCTQSALAQNLTNKQSSTQVNLYLIASIQARLDGWMDDLRFYVLFNSISVISGRCLDDNERLCAMELRLRLRRFHIE